VRHKPNSTQIVVYSQDFVALVAGPSPATKIFLTLQVFRCEKALALLRLDWLGLRMGFFVVGCEIVHGSSAKVVAGFGVTATVVVAYLLIVVLNDFGMRWFLGCYTPTH